ARDATRATNPGAAGATAAIRDDTRHAQTQEKRCIMTNPRIEESFAALAAGTYIKPIAGAAVGDAEKIYRWSLIHAAAGATCLDVRWEPEVVRAAARGRADALRRLPDEASAPAIMASVTPEGDVHTFKAQ